MANARVVVAVIVIALWLPVLILLSSLGGCQAGTTGLLRPIDADVEHGITNTVATVTHVASSAIPAPWGTAVEAGGAAILALLAAWQGLTHSKVLKIEVRDRETKKDPPA